MPVCCINNCPNRTGSFGSGQKQYFSFPEDPVLRGKWMIACGKTEETFKAEHGKVCQDHFEEECFEENCQPLKCSGKRNKLGLIQGSVPTRLLILQKRCRENRRERTPLFAYKELVSSLHQHSHATSVSVEEHNVCENETCRDAFIHLHNKMQELEKKNEALEVRIREMDEIIARLEKDKITDSQKLADDVLSKVFTPRQIKKLKSGNNSSIHWNCEDITSAIALRSLTPKGYRYLRDIKGFPLPSKTTLQTWCSQFSVMPGILKGVLQIMEDKGARLPLVEKVTVLTFDELYVSNKVEIDRKEQRVYGPSKCCQFIMARSLFASWKQPIL